MSTNVSRVSARTSLGMGHMQTSDDVAIADRAAVWQLIGRTPLVRLTRLEPHPGVEIHAKLESRNPGGSVKDRAASFILRDGLRRGALTPGRTILDATSGNTGIAYAMLGAAIGFPVKLCVPANVTKERQKLLRVYGAQIVWTDPMDGSDGAIREARRLYAADPERYFYADQYNNSANWRAHYDTTGVEILEQTARRVTHFVAGLGTSGTFMGTARRLREANAEVRLISMQPDSPLHGLEGLKHMATAIVPGIYDPTLADENVTVDTESAWTMVRRLAREEGIFAGVSGAAALVAARRVAASIDRGVIVTILPDGGDRYLSEPMLLDEVSDERPARFGQPQ
jgi:cysteine synthase B